jgi:hypothetical protein
MVKCTYARLGTAALGGFYGGKLAYKLLGMVLNLSGEPRE